MLRYSVIEVFTSEDSHWQGLPVAEAIQAYVRDLGSAARVVVTRAVSGSYEDGAVATIKIEVLAYRLPLKIEIVLPAAETELVLPRIQEMVSDGIVGIRELNSVSHRTRKHLIPGHLRVKDVMTAAPERVTAATAAVAVVDILLRHDFHGIPVVDDGERPIGMITQNDLIARGGMPVRLGLLGCLGRADLDLALAGMSGRTAGEIMTGPAVVIQAEQYLTAAVAVMLDNGLKRLPVVDAAGRLTGMLARLDVFRTIARENPTHRAAPEDAVPTGSPLTITDVMRRDMHTVGADTPLEEVLKLIDASGSQRIVVLDPAGRFLGLIFDQDLLRLFLDRKTGFWDRIASRFSFADAGRSHGDLLARIRKGTAGEIMKTGLVCVAEDATIAEAFQLMTTRPIKRLPVVDAAGRFKGMLSREALLRAAMAAGVDF